MTEVISAWSRRRAAVAAEAEAERRAAEEALIAQQHAELAEKPDEEILKELGLPDPDSLSLGDDFKAFMSKTVPAHLRKRALRTLWRSNPVLACVDGLNDYDGDYLTGSFGQEPIKTTYQVGKGMLSHIVEMARQKEAALLPAEPVVAEEEIAETVAVVEPECAHEALVESGEAEAMHAPPRRMTFDFEDNTA